MADNLINVTRWYWVHVGKQGGTEPHNFTYQSRATSPTETCEAAGRDTWRSRPSTTNRPHIWAIARAILLYKAPIGKYNMLRFTLEKNYVIAKETVGDADTVDEASRRTLEVFPNKI